MSRNENGRTDGESLKVLVVDDDRSNLNSLRKVLLRENIAVETANLTRNSILQQAAISVLGQANLQPQAALSLLG